MSDNSQGRSLLTLAMCPAFSSPVSPRPDYATCSNSVNLQRSDILVSIVGLLFAAPIATPILPGIEPIVDRVQFCKPLLGVPLWVLSLTVFAASFVTAGVAVQRLAVPAFAGQEQVPGEDGDIGAPLAMRYADRQVLEEQEEAPDSIQLQPLTRVHQFGGLEQELKSL